MRALRDPHAFMRRFPPRTIPDVWCKTRTLFLGRADGIEETARILREVYGLPIECRSDLDSVPPDAAALDAVVVFGDEFAERFLSNESYAAFLPKSIAVSHGALPGNSLARFAAVVSCPNPESAEQLCAGGLRAWNAPSNSPEDIGGVLLQPLSIILGGAAPLKGFPGTAADHGKNSMSLPIWMYWEGDCPGGSGCVRGPFAITGGDVRLLTPGRLRSHARHRSRHRSE